MTFSFLGPDPVEAQVNDLLGHLAAGNPPRDIEVAQVDCKEEPGRRPEGVLQPGQSTNEQAVQYLAKEMTCFANTPGGGAIILGVADDGTRIGTELDPEWLRHRIWQITQSQLTIDAQVVDLDGTRLLVLRTHEAVEPIRASGKIYWRVDDNCVEVDATSWHAGKLHRSGVDWSVLPSGHKLADAKPAALDVARRYLTDAGDESATDLAAATDEDLLRRLNLVADGEGTLTNAGSLLFVETPAEGIDYIRRDVPGGDSTTRVRSNRPLIEQVREVDQAMQATNRTVHVGGGFAKGQLRALPQRAAREAVVNGVVHRDWLSKQPTTVEHTGDMLVVTSPGGFVGGITPGNIITHPSVPRYKALAEATASLRLAEREGIGVDRMVRDMLALGFSEPEITEVHGPMVRVSLIGGDPDADTMSFLSDLDPPETANDLDALLLIDHLTRTGFLDERSAAPTLQRPLGESAAALARLADVEVAGQPITRRVEGTPSDSPPAWRLTQHAADHLAHRMQQLDGPDARTRMLMQWARERGRISSTEAADLANVTQTYAGQLLTALEEAGELVPSRNVKRGRGFFYTVAGTS